MIYDRQKGRFSACRAATDASVLAITCRQVRLTWTAILPALKYYSEQPDHQLQDLQAVKSKATLLEQLLYM